VQIRDYATDKHRSVDDTPAGGGAGMVMRADMLAAALDANVPKTIRARACLMSPRGKPLTQARVRDLADGPGVVIVCGRFEGVDQRVIEGAISRKSRSATTCCRAARWRRRSCSTR
jgi:tRNA (guanine37-N1)-methyltransferase